MTSHIENRKDVYVVEQNTDMTEGKGTPIYFAWCLNPVTAERIAQGQGPMGTDAPVRKLMRFKIDGVWYVPMPLGQITPPTKSDEAHSKLHAEAEEIIDRLKAAGITPEEIEKVTKSAELRADARR